MSDFEEKLNALLSSPESMAQVAELAKTLSAQSGGNAPEHENGAPAFHSGDAPPSSSVPKGNDAPKTESTASEDAPAKDGIGDIASLLGNIDFNMISKLLPLLGGGNKAASHPQGDSPAASLDGLSSLLGGIDAKTISKFLPLIAEMNDGKQDQRTQLLYALKPFIKPERGENIDRALKLAKLFRAAKLFFKGMGE